MYAFDLFTYLFQVIMASDDMDMGIEWYLYEPDKEDYLNIVQEKSDDDSNSDNEGETFGNYCEGRSMMAASTWYIDMDIM